MRLGLAIAAIICVLGNTGHLTGAEQPLALPVAVEVDGQGVFLHQLLPNYTEPRIRLADAPPLSQPISFSRAKLIELVSRQRADISTLLTNWTGPEAVQISRRSRKLEESELKDLITTVLQQEEVGDRGSLELRFTRSWAPVAIPDDPLTLRVLELPTARITPAFVVRFELATPHEVLGIWQTAVQARVLNRMLVAGSAQPRGRALRDADVRIEERDLLQVREPLNPGLREDPSLELAENLYPGAPITLRSIRRRPVVVRGKLLDAVVQQGSLQITVKVQALEDGLPGQTIRVRNARSRREFQALVQNEAVVVVPL